MNRQDTVERRIMKLFSDQMSLDVPTRDLDLLRSGYLDSMTFVTLLQHLEGEFGVRIGLEELDLDRFQSIARIAEFVTAQRGSDNVVNAG